MRPRDWPTTSWVAAPTSRSSPPAARRSPYPTRSRSTSGLSPLLPRTRPWIRSSRIPAAQLFVERARAARPGTVFDESDIVAIGRVTRALDGMPLAVELAAARASTMSPVEISDRLDHRFALLTTGSRTAEARQRTLRATVDWSYALLSSDEQRLFNRLSVFQGGWTMDAAEAVLDDTGAPEGFVLDAVARLVERSMVIVEPGSPTRYRMLETLRQYAAEQLLDSGEVASVAARHARHFHDLVVAAELDLRGPRQRDALLLLRREQPNVRAALNWLSGPDGDLDQALEMAGSLGLFWHLGRHLEGREVLHRLLALGGSERGARSRAAGGLDRRTPPWLSGAPEPAVRRHRTGESRHVRRRG